MNGAALPRDRLSSDGLDDEALAAIGAVVGEVTGLQFPPGKRREMASRLSPLFVEHGGPAELARRVRADAEVLQDAVNSLTIGESYFFRNHPHFEALRERILPELAARHGDRRRLSIWCAGCATGEEPYSIAMLLDERFPALAGWDVSILGTDINTEFLARAAEAVYPPWSFRGVEQRIIDRYFEPEGERRRRLKGHVRARVRFERFNLGQLPFPRAPEGAPFDIVLCRNVLIYFSHDLADAAVPELTRQVAPRGYLLVGHAEAFPSLRALEAVYSNATYYYRKPEDGAQPRATRLPVRTLSIPGLPVAVLAPDPAAFQGLPPRPGKARPPEAPPRPAPPVLRRISTIPPAAPEPAETELARIRDLIEEGELEAASALIGPLLLGPAQIDHRAHFLAGLIADIGGRPAEALASLRQAIFLERRFVIGHYYQGVICEREGDPRTAARCLRNALRLLDELPGGGEVEGSGGITAGRLAEIVRERIRELEGDPAPAGVAAVRS